MIREAVIITLNEDRSPHLTPLGYRRGPDEQVILAPFVPSQTLENLRARGVAVLNFTDDVRVIAGCLTGHRDWPLMPTHTIPAYRLRDALAHYELEVDRLDDDPQRPTFYCKIRTCENHQPFLGYNRAQAAVLEAAILATRLDWLEPAKVRDELTYLAIAIQKTAGANETRGVGVAHR